jgi:5-keto-L-gluconate epimerase
MSLRLSTVLSTQPAQFDAIVYKGDVDDNIGRIAEIGYDGVELAVRDPALLDVDGLEQSLRKHGLAVPALGTGQAYGEEKLSFTAVDPDVRSRAIARIKNHIELAQRFNAVVIVGLIRGVTPPGADKVQAMRWLVQALGECCEDAMRADVRLVLEPINRYETDLINTVEEALLLLERVGCSNLGLLPDTFHMNIEEPSIEHSMRKAAPALFHFHVADSNRWYPGAGHLDFKSILLVLKEELNYTGWISAETLPYPDPRTAAEQGLKKLRGVLSEAVTEP